MKWFLPLIAFASILVSPAFAQDDEHIPFGEVVTGEITNRDFEIPYTFEGRAGDVIIAEMLPVEVLGDMDDPAVILLDPDFNLITSHETSRASVFAAMLPVDGEYTLLASRRDGRAGDSVGEYTLRVLKPQTLTPGEPLQEFVSYDLPSYFVVRNEGNFTLTYDRVTPDYEFAPQIAISVIDDGSLEDIATINGLVPSVTITTPTPNNVIDAYVISLNRALFDFSGEGARAEFTITLQE